jgi:hypothetical protein
VDRLAARVRRLYFRQRTPVALILVATVTVASVVDYAPVQITAAVALLSLILQVIFEIDEKVTNTRTTIWYSTFQEALPHMTEEIEKRLSGGRTVRMSWVGVTHEAGWPFSQNILLKVLDGRLGSSASLRVELAFLDPDGEMCKRPDGPDRDQIRSTKEKIARFATTHHTQLTGHNSGMALYLYDHRPTWHALLIDDDTLFYSTCLPQNLPFASPQGGVEVVKDDAGEHSAERIRHFIAWFNIITLEARAAGKFVGSPTV